MPFHGLVEIVSFAMFAFAFALAWDPRGYLANNYLWLLGVSYASCTLINLLHSTVAQGMKIFATGRDNDQPPALWLAAHYATTTALAAASLIVKRGIDHRIVYTYILGQLKGFVAALIKEAFRRMG